MMFIIQSIFDIIPKTEELVRIYKKCIIIVDANK